MVGFEMSIKQVLIFADILPIANNEMEYCKKYRAKKREKKRKTRTQTVR